MTLLKTVTMIVLSFISRGGKLTGFFDVVEQVYDYFAVGLLLWNAQNTSSLSPKSRSSGFEFSSNDSNRVFVVCPATLGSGHNVNETWRLGLEILETKNG